MEQAKQGSVMTTSQAYSGPGEAGMHHEINHTRADSPFDDTDTRGTALLFAMAECY
jgi:hypothetical protein